MDQQEIKIKLLTLLNVVAAKPNINNNDTDWLEIARRTIKTKQSIQQKQQQEQEEEEELEQSTEQQEEVDSYHYHFGPQTTIINPNSIKLAQQEDAWKLTSNQKTKDDRRIVNFQLDSTITCPKLTPKIHKSLQSTLQKFNHNENRFFSSINQYQDVWFTGLSYDHNRDHSRTATSLWALQHILNADLIIGSPVGLRKFIEKEGDADFLSSIEISIVDQMDVIQMQNWEHVEIRISLELSHGIDSHSQHIRQTILYSSQISAEQTCLFRRNLKNIRGKQIEFGNVKEISQGVLWKIRKGLKQTWLSFDSSSSGNDPDQSRLDFFRNKILDPLLSSALVFKYIRNQFKIRGAQQIIFYSPPYNPQFYTEFVNVFPFLTSTNLDRKSARDQDQDLKIVDVNDLSVFVLFNKLDLPQIERIIGLEHTRKIVKSIQSDPTGSNNSFTFL
ncbi:hypothetical protein KEM48_010076 [Puccinia striiformis f. sp. tritici PST-130]|nr:hypothetical protein KEM48_010076 [Puccinia striiformis f. sp. tritici PST-130]